MRTTISLKQNDLNLSSHVDLLILKFLTLVDSNVKLYITSAKTLHDTTLYSQIFSGLVLTFLMLCTSLVSLCLPHALFTLLLFSTPYAIWKAQLFYGLFFSSTNDLVLHAYSDVNCTRDPLTVLQLLGIVSYYSRDALISLQSKKQTVMVEYRALVDTVVELIWLHSLLKDKSISICIGTLIYCAIQITHNNIF